jgi:hypothetical protein
MRARAPSPSLRVMFSPMLTKLWVGPAPPSCALSRSAGASWPVCLTTGRRGGAPGQHFARSV